MKLVWILVFTGITACGQPSTPWRVLAKLAEERSEADDMAGAEALAKEALNTATEQLKVEHPQLIPLSTQYSGILHAQSRDAEAESVVRRAVEIANRFGDEKFLGIALNGLANALWGEGQAARAEPVMRRSLVLFERSEGMDAIDTAKAANNLASLYSDTGQYEAAEKTMEQALAVYERHYASHPALYAMGLVNMFVILFDQKRTAEAEPYLKRAVEIGGTAFPGSLKMAQLRFAQAALDESKGKFREAAGLLQQVIDVQERLLGAQHPQLARSLLAYSVVLRKMHQKSEAQLAEKRGAEILKSLR